MKLFIAILCEVERTGWLCPALVNWILSANTPPSVDAEVSLVCGYWPVSHARCVAVERARAAGADWILQTDNDQAPHPETVARIAVANERGIDVLGFATPTIAEGGDIIPNVQAGDVADAKHDELFEQVPEFGAGVLAVRMSVFERLLRPYFRVGINEQLEECGVGHAVGEDLNFCRALRAAGVRLHIARSVGADHFKTVSLLSIFQRSG